ncbi:MAG TPA: glycoside hydrolase family 2 protein [Aridibacter sp.]|nr:glycoside hydrolase family 2 protein [Aridibacter sp.]
MLLKEKTKISRLIITALILSAVSLSAHARSVSRSVFETEISDGWQFRQVGKDVWHRAEVPGCVHTDLLKNGLIEDPFYRDNEKDLQWIGKTDWEYRTTFDVSREQLSKQRLELVFEGLDTYADVSLNGAPLVSTDNMFRTWQTDVKGKLKEGANTLHIRFRSPINEILPLMSKLDYQIPAPNDQGEVTSPYTRKAPYHFGWDWGPRFVTSGIWRPVKLRTWNEARIESVFISQDKVTAERADITAEVEVEVDKAGKYKVVIGRGDWTGGDAFDLRSGTNKVRITFSIDKPDLWYPAGLGDQPMYTFKASLSGESGPLDEETVRTGLRSVELRQKIDQWGKSFEFVINGIPVFAKGGNWIPADSFNTRVTEKRYRHLLESFRDANMNMVRVWGGGIYEEDVFYEIADELGLMVWQDFMFGVSMYPGDKGFLDNVRGEAIDNVKRLRNHPSIVLWCGNNESETAWQHWGWKERLPDVLWENYKKIFLRLLPEVVEEYDPTREYWSSSPSSDLEDDADSQKSGDVHYWAVWHAELPFSEYEKQFPRFMSEYGFQAFPPIDTVRAYTTEEDRKSIETPVMLAHQRHPRGNQLIREYMLREFEEPKDFESFLYVSQVLQAEGIKLGTEHLRRIMPRNMGALYWQLNDTWPVASWSSTDYFGRWKALHYYAQDFFEKVLVSPTVEGDELRIYVVSDDPNPTRGMLTLTTYSLDGEKVFSTEKEIEAEGLKSKVYLSIGLEEALGGRNKNDVMFSVKLANGGEVISQNEYFPLPFKDMNFSDPGLSAKVHVEADDGIGIQISTKKVARAVMLTAAGIKGRFSNNFFNLTPGSLHFVLFKPEGDVTEEQLAKSLKAMSMTDAFMK